MGGHLRAPANVLQRCRGERDDACRIVRRRTRAEPERPQIIPTATSGGKPGTAAYAVEDLLYRHGVDLAFYGHVHDYTRFLPVYNHTVMGTDYTEPKATVHFTIGGGGNPEMTDTPIDCAHYVGKAWAPWAAETAEPYGSCIDVNYGRALAVNASHLRYQQVSVTTRARHRRHLGRPTQAR